MHITLLDALGLFNVVWFPVFSFLFFSSLLFQRSHQLLRSKPSLWCSIDPLAHSSSSVPWWNFQCRGIFHSLAPQFSPRPGKAFPHGGPSESCPFFSFHSIHSIPFPSGEFLSACCFHRLNSSPTAQEVPIRQFLARYLCWSAHPISTYPGNFGISIRPPPQEAPNRNQRFSSGRRERKPRPKWFDTYVLNQLGR